VLAGIVRLDRQLHLLGGEASDLLGEIELGNREVVLCLHEIDAVGEQLLLGVEHVEHRARAHLRLLADALERDPGGANGGLQRFDLRAPLELVVATKGLAHWLTTGLPLVIAAPLIGLLLNLDAPAEITLVLTLLVGTPALTFIGLIGAAIAVTLRRGGLLLAVIVLPLTVPVLIFGVAAANAVGPTPFGTPFTILCALTLASLVVGPFAAAAALRQEME